MPRANGLGEKNHNMFVRLKTGGFRQEIPHPPRARKV